MYFQVVLYAHDCSCEFAMVKELLQSVSCAVISSQHTIHATPISYVHIYTIIYIVILLQYMLHPFHTSIYIQLYR